MNRHMILLLAATFAAPAFAQDSEPETTTDDETQLEAVVVTATPLRRTTTEIAQPVEVLTGNELEERLDTNIGETLSGELGISSSYFGPGASRPIIRGLGGPRVKVLEDGIESLDVSTVSDDHAVGIDPFIAKQIEILRGPSTLLYGGGAIGGVVNVVSNRVPERVPEQPLEGGAELYGDSVADEQTAVLRLDGGAGNWAWHVDGLDRETNDYEIPGVSERDPDEPLPEGVLPNSSLETQNYAGGVSYIADRGMLGVSVSRYESNYGVPGGHGHEEDEEEPGHEEEEEDPVRIDLEQTRFDLKGALFEPLPIWEKVNLRVGLNDYEHVELEGAETGTLFNNDAVEARLEFLHSPWGAWRGAYGLQLESRDFEAIGAEAFVPPTETTALGLFLVESRPAGAWTVEVGGRIDSVEHDAESGLPDVDENAFSVSLGGTRPLYADYLLALNVSRSQRAASPEELFSNGPHLATGNFEIGDPTLESETSLNLDASIGKALGAFTWKFNVFRNRIEDYIFLDATGETDPDEELPVFLWTQDDARFTGFEAEVGFALWQNDLNRVDLTLWSDYVEAELSGTNEDLPRIPPLRRGLSLEFARAEIHAGVDLARYSEQTRTADFETETAGYTMLDAHLSYELPFEPFAIELFAKGRNLFDEEARKHTSFVKENAPLPGRNFVFGVRGYF